MSLGVLEGLAPAPCGYSFLWPTNCTTQCHYVAHYRLFPSGHLHFKVGRRLVEGSEDTWTGLAFGGRGRIMDGGTAFLFALRLNMASDLAMYSLTGQVAPSRLGSPAGGLGAQYSAEDGWGVVEWRAQMTRMRRRWPPPNWPGVAFAFPVGLNPLTSDGDPGYHSTQTPIEAHFLSRESVLQCRDGTRVRNGLTAAPPQTSPATTPVTPIPSPPPTTPPPTTPTMPPRTTPTTPPPTAPTTPTTLAATTAAPTTTAPITPPTTASATTPPQTTTAPVPATSPIILSSTNHTVSSPAVKTTIPSPTSSPIATTNQPATATMFTTPPLTSTPFASSTPGQPAPSLSTNTRGTLSQSATSGAAVTESTLPFSTPRTPPTTPFSPSYTQSGTIATNPPSTVTNAGMATTLIQASPPPPTNADSTCSEREMRVVSGTGSTGLGHGRVEVCFAGAWGSVCDDGFDATAAQVVCTALGWDEADGDVVGLEGYSEGVGEIWLDDVVCTGAESWLGECGHGGWARHNCRHSEDVAIDCRPPDARPVPESMRVRRCALYPTLATLEQEVAVGCPEEQRCVPDDMDCTVVDSCRDPVGWCTPMVQYDY